MHKVVTLILIATLGVGFLYLAWRQGEERQSFTWERSDKEIPIPLIFDWMDGTAEELDDGRIRTHLGSIMLPKDVSRNYLLCIGSFSPSDASYYLLELDGVLYVEKGEFIEPLIYALYQLHQGDSGKPMPGSIRDVIALLPDDRQLLVNLAARIPKQSPR